MPSSIIDKVNKMGADDGNQTLKCFDCHKPEYDFFEEDEQLNIEKENEDDLAPMNLPGIELEECDKADQDEEFNIDDMNEMARQSENNADIMVIGSEYVQQDLPREMNIEEEE